MANVTTIYACTQNGLYIFNKPGTLPEWLPPKHVLEDRPVLSAWAEPGLHVRVLAVARPGNQTDEHADGGELLLSENGGRSWEAALEAPVTAVLGLAGEEGTP